MVRQLAAQAELERDSRNGGLEESVRMAGEALHRSLELKEPSEAADRSLRRSLALLPKLVAHFDTGRFDAGLGGSEGVVYAPDGSFAAAIGHKAVQLLDPVHGETEVLRLEGRAETLAVAAKGRWLAVVLEQGSAVDLYDLEGGAGAEPRRLEPDFAATALAFDAGGSRLAIAGDGEVIVVSTADGGREAQLDLAGTAREVAFTAGGEGLVVESAAEAPGRTAVRLVRQTWRWSSGWPEEGERRALEVKEPAAARYFDFSDDGTLVATSTNGLHQRHEPCRLRLWRLGPRGEEEITAGRGPGLLHRRPPPCGSAASPAGRPAGVCLLPRQRRHRGPEAVRARR